jgi:ribose transport system substrate-binding protein
LILVFVCLLIITSLALEKKQVSYRFVIIPKVVHLWFDLVHQGTKMAATMIEQQTGSKFTREYRSPQRAEIVEQNEIFELILHKGTALSSI